MSESYGLSSRTIAVTGCTGGVGWATAELIVRSGGNVVINGRNEAKLLERKNYLHTIRENCAVAVPGDITQDEVIEKFLHSDRNIDGVVLAAGIGLQGSLCSSDLSKAEEVFRTNVIACAKLLQSGSNFFKTKATSTSPIDIVAIGSTVGIVPSDYSCIYSSSKFALHCIMESLRKELAPEGIRVTLIAPGFIETGFHERNAYDENWKRDVKAQIGQGLRPSDVASSVAFAMSQPADVSIGTIILRPTKQAAP
jgi:NADP-dependent 3-hydroxy acid dehydrogenase YdfG